MPAQLRGVDTLGGVALERPTDLDSRDVHDVYAHYGLAMYEVQCVERQLVILFPMLREMHPGRNTQEELDSLWDSLSRKTFGDVVKLAGGGALPKGIEERLEKARKLRNWLVHHYFRDRARQFVSSEGRNGMRAELTRAVGFLSSLDGELTELGRAYRRSIGVTDEDVASIKKDLLTSVDWEPGPI